MQTLHIRVRKPSLVVVVVVVVININNKHLLMNIYKYYSKKSAFLRRWKSNENRNGDEYIGKGYSFFCDDATQYCCFYTVSQKLGKIIIFLVRSLSNFHKLWTFLAKRWQ